jgi:alanine racemase
MDELTRRAWVDVDLAALKRNAAAVARHAGRPILPMVKADAYGLGATEVSRALLSLNPWAFGVATLAEARELRVAGIEHRILIFTPVLPADFPLLRELRVTPTLGLPEVIAAWISSGGGHWHLAIDTGMHRAGIEWWRVKDVVELVRTSPPQGAFTHFHSADAGDASVELQEARFVEAVAALPQRPEYLHVENSPGIERRGGSPWDLVRPGVFLYGVRTSAAPGLVPEPVAHFRARVVELRHVRDGEGVSYGLTWRARGTRRVATLAVGYADGYRRLFGNRGRVLIRGALAPVVGRITMDMTMVDVTDVACALGDVATLLGRDDAYGELAINAVADAVELLTYELLVGLRLRVPRRYQGGA